MIDDQVDRERGKAQLTDGYDLKIWGMIKVEKIKRIQSLRIEAFFLMVPKAAIKNGIGENQLRHCAQIYVMDKCRMVDNRII